MKKKSSLLEIACDSVQSAIYAEQAGADRIELCENLAQGGVTPSAAKIKLAKKYLNIPVFVLIRPRKGDFHYSDLEHQTMIENIRIAKDLGADGIVSGALQTNGNIDVTQTEALVKSADHLPFTFHRAFDMCQKAAVALEQLIEIGVKRILTSGYRNTAIEGRKNITQLIEQANERMTVIAGAGIRAHNIEELFAVKGLYEFHSSAKQTVYSKMEHRGIAAMGNEDSAQEFEWQEVNPATVRAMKIKLECRIP